MPPITRLLPGDQLVRHIGADTGVPMLRNAMIQARLLRIRVIARCLN